MKLWSHSYARIVLSLIVSGSTAIAFAQDAEESPAIRSGVPDYDKAIKFFQERIKQQPKSPANYVMLAQRYTRKAKDTGAEECYGLAEEALKKALSMSPKDPGARLMMAGVLGFRHQFAEGLKLAQGVLAENPKDEDALTAVHDLQVGLGDYDAASKSLDALTRLNKQASVGVLVRQAHLSEVRGKDDEALQLMQRATEGVLESAGDFRSPGVAWFQMRLGHQLLDMGRIDAAAKQFEETYKGLPEYFLGVAGFAEVRAAQGRFDEALDLYAATIKLCPDPIFYMAVGDIHTLRGDAAKAKAAYDTAEKTIIDSDAEPSEYARELSLFYSERNLQTKKAVELAQIDLKYRHDLQGHDALAWALYRDGQFADAAKSIDQALSTGTKNAKVHYHAGMIYYRLGNKEAAKKHLGHALQYHPKFSILDVDVAKKTLGELNAS